MRPLMLVPAAAFLALAACGDDTQTAQTEPEATTAQPADTAAAPPAVTTTAPATDTAAAPAAGGTATAPVQETTSAPATTTTTATAPAGGTDTVETTGAVGAGSLEPGVYQSQNVSLELGPDGNFMLMNPNTGDEAQGQYQLDGNLLVLEGQQMEPMTCEVIQAGEGFELSATDPSCEPLDGESFQRQS